MDRFTCFPMTSIALATSVLAMSAQAQVGSAPAPESAASAPDATAQPAIQDAARIVIQGSTIGLRQVRANVKIGSEDLASYPPGVSADKVLERVSGIQLGSSNAFGGDGFESTINMRGFAKDSIGFSIDGVPNGRTTLGGGSVPTRFFDSSNLAGVDVSQSAGVIGAPSHQSLVGHVNYLTQDPSRRFGLRAEVAAGSADTRRAYARLDSGELAPGLTGYVSLSKEGWKVSYIDNPAGKNGREHADVKLVAKLGNGGTLKLRSGYNDRTEESGTNIVTLAQFRANPKADGYTDAWTGVPATDRNYRGFKGNPRTDWLTHVEASLPLTDALKLDARVYYHTQDGVGKESSLGNAGFPGLDGRATSLYFRANNYTMVRRGALGELAGKLSDLIDWRVGGWVERHHRGQRRDWHAVLNEAVGPDYDPTPTTRSEDKRWENRIQSVYAANRSSLFGGALKLDYGVTYIDNQVDYTAPIQDSRTNRFNYVNQASVHSGLLPKVGAVFALRENTEVFAGLARNAASVTDATLEGGAAPTLAAAARINRMDTADAFDIGIRHKGDDHVFGVQAFSIRSKETVAADIVGTLQSENVDQGRRIQGMEVTYNARFGDWRLYAAGTVQKHRYELADVDAAGYPPRGFIRNGADLVGIADRNLFVEATWRPNDALRLAVNARHTSSRAGYYANPRIANSGVDERLPAYTLLGLSASWAFQHVTLGMNLENLGNKTYIAGIAPELMTSPSTVGRYFIGAPRSVMLWLKAAL